MVKEIASFFIFFYMMSKELSSCATYTYLVVNNPRMTSPARLLNSSA